MALGVLTFYAASMLPTVAGQQIGPQVFPMVMEADSSSADP